MAIVLEGLSFRWIAGQKPCYLDQSRLPAQVQWVEVNHPHDWIRAVERLAIRGAPLIGLSGGVVWVWWMQQETIPLWEREQAYFAMRQARPTAVTLVRVMDDLWQHWQKTRQVEALQDRVVYLWEQEIRGTQALIDHFFQNHQPPLKPWRVLTYCHTGSLATVGPGTALGLIEEAWKRGWIEQVYVAEARPLGQGIRLTHWELTQKRIPHQVLADNMVALWMAQGRVDRVWVGADRISQEGHVANKVGTLMLALCAKVYQVPFEVAASSLAWDPSWVGYDPNPAWLEYRACDELFRLWGFDPLQGMGGLPAFDVTPAEWVDQIWTEKGPFFKMTGKGAKEVRFLKDQPNP